MMFAARAVLFDLDGTLIDSAPDLGAAADKMRVDRGLPSLPLEHYRPMAGAGARGMLGIAFGITPEHAEFEALREEFFRKERDAFQRDGQFRLQYLDALRAQTAAEREAAQVGSAVASIETQIRTKRAQRDAYQSDWLAKANGELVAAQRDAARLQEQFRKFDHTQSLVEITAPADAIVLSVKTRTPGAVLRSAEVLFELVPVDVPLEVELDVSPRDVARLQKDDEVTIKIDALPFVKHGTVAGKLRFISEDTFDKTLTGQQGPVYRARVAVGKLELTGAPPGFRLVPGMTVTGDVKVGSRRLVTYITYPVTRAFSTSFREP